jgi:hypothetical protein
VWLAGLGLYTGGVAMAVDRTARPICETSKVERRDGVYWKVYEGGIGVVVEG